MNPSCTCGSGSAAAGEIRASAALARKRAAAALGLRSATATYTSLSRSVGVFSCDVAVDAGITMQATDATISDDRRIVIWPATGQMKAFFMEFSREQAPSVGACDHAPAESPNAHVSCEEN
jgi:hypothetical protein